MFTILNFSSDRMIQFRCGGLSRCVRLRQPNALLMSFRKFLDNEQVHCVRSSAFPKTKWNIWPINVIRVTSSWPCCWSAKQFYVNAINSKLESPVVFLFWCSQWSFVTAAQAIKPNLLRENKTFAQKLMQQHLVFVVRRKNGRTKINCIVSTRLSGNAIILGWLLCWCNPVKLYFAFFPGVATISLGPRTKEIARCIRHVSK